MAQHPGFIAASTGDASTEHRRGKVTVEVRVWAPAWASREYIQTHFDAAVADALAQLDDLWPGEQGEHGDGVRL